MVPYDTLDLSNPQVVGILDSNISFSNANEALIQVQKNANLSVHNTTFEENFSLGRGSILFSEYLTSYAFFNSSVFLNNYAMTGGVFFT